RPRVTVTLAFGGPAMTIVAPAMHAPNAPPAPDEIVYAPFAIGTPTKGPATRIGSAQAAGSGDGAPVPPTLPHCPCAFVTTPLTAVPATVDPLMEEPGATLLLQTAEPVIVAPAAALPF